MSDDRRKNLIVGNLPEETVAALQDARMPMSDEQPRVTDNDAGEITVILAGRVLRSWVYAGDTGRRTKMLAARQYVEGWCDGRDRIRRILGGGPT